MSYWKVQGHSDNIKKSNYILITAKDIDTRSSETYTEIWPLGVNPIPQKQKITEYLENY
jgi:hypothetical protein